MGIWIAAVLRKAEIEDPLVAGDRVVRQEEHSGRRLAVRLGKLDGAGLEIQPVDHDQIRLAKRPGVGRPGLEGVRVGSVRHDLG